MSFHRHLTRMIRYNGWANSKVLEQAVKVLPDQPQYTGRYGLLADELLHVLNGQLYWLARWRRTKAEAPENPSRPELVAEFARSQAELESYLAGLDEAALDAVYHHKSRLEEFSAPLGDFIAHLVGHGTYHRGEIALRLTEAGASPGDIDLYDFIYQTGG